MAKIDLISHIYPTTFDPSSGIFIQREAHLLKIQHELKVWIPTVYALPGQKQYDRSLDPVSESYPVTRLKYLSIPRKKLPAFTIRNLSKALIKHLMESDSDLIHVHWLFPSGFCIPFLKEHLKKPVVLTLHGGDWYSNQNSGKDELINKTLHACDSIITVGHQLKEDILLAYPEIENKIHHVPHGIDTQLFSPVPDSDKEKLRQNLNWDPDLKHLLCVANLYEAKGVDILIKAFAKCKDLGELKLHIVAPRRDKKITAHLFDLIDNYKLKEHIYFYPSMSESELVQFYRAADLFISPSKNEGFGLAVAEAISCGIPVVATKSGGPEEIVTEDVGLLVPTDDSDSLAKEIDNILAELSSFSIEKMHEHIGTKFSLKAKLKSLNEIYSQLLT